MKTLTKDAVLTVALKLTENGNTTTSLDIKNELRNQGYWAEQREVSKLMNEIYNEDDNWAFIIDVDHRVYFYPMDTLTIDPGSLNNQSSNSMDARELQAPKDECWEVSCAGFPKQIYIGGEVTRNQARYYFAKMNGSDYTKTNAIRFHM